MEDAFLALPGPDQHPGARERLAAIFDADHARERARSRRHRLLALLGVLGLPLWLTVVWPARLPAALGTLVATAWAVTFASLLVALGWEGITHRRRARQIATLGPLPVLRSARRAAAATAACAAAAEDQD